MKNYSTKLSKRLLPQIRLAKVRNRRNINSLKSLVDKFFSAKNGSKISSLFRHIFEHKNIKKILGANMAIMMIVSSFVPTQVTGTEYEATIVKEGVIPLSTKITTRFPVEKVKINQGYSFFHPGLDFDGVVGEPIYPIKNGYVEAVEYSRFAYGNAVIVRHSEGYTSLYAHLSKIDVKKGDRLTTRDVIGEMGSTGRSTGAHLHLEIRKNGFPVYPYAVLPKN